MAAQTVRRDPMQLLESRLNSLRRSSAANNARIRAAMLQAIIGGADPDVIERMARAVLLNLDDEADQPPA